MINAVKTPLGTVYKVHKEGSSSALLMLNGHEELNIAPTLKDEITRIYISDKGMFLVMVFILNYRVIQNFASSSRAEMGKAPVKLTISPSNTIGKPNIGF